ncbi:MAG: calcium/sodium antiporter [Bacteroidales bacterium]|nr:calcium/sodium antiporter [Bacteroidales bacterium]
MMLLAGLALLLFSGEYLVRASVSLAGYLKISRVVVGLTVVSFGTSAPELVVSLDAAILGYPDISVGNVVGSNISNIGLVLALTVILAPYFVNTRSIIWQTGIMLGVTILIILLFIDKELSRLEGIVLLALLVSFVYFSIRKSRKDIRGGNGEYPVTRYKLPLTVIIIIIACLGLVAGANLLVRGASGLANMMGVSERVISVSVIALGTSLPELATSAVAAVRRENDISISNIVGSNIFNILAILGITATVKTFRISDPFFTVDMIWMLGISLILILMILPLKGTHFTRRKGIILGLLYFTYIYMVFFIR